MGLFDKFSKTFDKFGYDLELFESKKSLSLPSTPCPEWSAARVPSYALSPSGIEE